MSKSNPANQHTKRSNLKDEFFTVHKLLLRHVSRLGRVVDDDRWFRYVEDLSDVYLADVERIKAVVDRVHAELVKGHERQLNRDKEPARGQRGPGINGIEKTGDDVQIEADEGTFT